MVAMLPTTSPFSLDTRAEIPKQGAEVKHLAMISFCFLSISTLLLCIVHTLHHDPTSPLLSFSKLPSSDKQKPLEAFHAPHFSPPRIFTSWWTKKKSLYLHHISLFPNFSKYSNIFWGGERNRPKKREGGYIQSHHPSLHNRLPIAEIVIRLHRHRCTPLALVWRFGKHATLNSSWEEAFSVRRLKIMLGMLKGWGEGGGLFGGSTQSILEYIHMR